MYRNATDRHRTLFARVVQLLRGVLAKLHARYVVHYNYVCTVFPSMGRILTLTQVHDFERHVSHLYMSLVSILH
jgi:hypothetical protein